MPRIAKQLKPRNRRTGSTRNSKPVRFAKKSVVRSTTPARMAAILRNRRHSSLNDTTDEELTDGDWISTTNDWADGDWLENNA